MPEGSEDPVIELSVGETIAAMYLSFYSTILDNNQITDYLVRVIQPRLSTLPGVQRALIIGDRTFAMRIWLKPDRLAALNLTASDIQTALQANNVQSAVGATKGALVSVDLKANTDLQTAEEFRNLVLRSEGDAIVRLGDVADVVLGAETYNTEVSFNGQSATFIGVEVAPDANALDVVARVRQEWPDILAQLPQGLEANIPYDSTRYIRNAISEVVITLGEAVLIVIVVIFLFLGSLRSVIIPAVTVPLSIIGALFLMWVMGFSINLLTLLAMVLAIGMVVDDAIIVLENIHRHIEAGMKPFDAAIKGARELGLPVIAMTITLVAVYLPIGFVGGMTGTLFVEFAFTLAGAVLLSGVIALTLSPMMCSKLLRLRDEGGGHRLEKWLDRQFDRLRHGYQRRLHGALNDKQVIAVFGVVVLASTYFLYLTSPRELAPEEDQGFMLIFSQSDPYASLDYLTRFTHELTLIANNIPEKENYFLMNGVGGSGSAVGTDTAISGIVMKPWNERKRTTQPVIQEVQEKAGQVAGFAQNAVFAPPPLPTGGAGFPVEFVVASTQPIQVLNELAGEILQRGYASRKFIFLDTDLGDRQAADQHRGGSRQGGAARDRYAPIGQRSGRHDVRRLRDAVLDGEPQLQGHSPGPTHGPPQPRPAHAVLHAHRLGQTRSDLHAGDAARISGTAAAQTIPAVERGDHLRCTATGRDVGRGAGGARTGGQGSPAARLHRGLRGSIAPV